MSYSSYYNGKWQYGETGATPITPGALNYMENGIAEAHVIAENAGSVAAAAAATADKALPKAGGTMTGMLILTEGVHYGDNLPAPGNKGRIFFKKV